MILSEGCVVLTLGLDCLYHLGGSVLWGPVKNDMPTVPFLLSLVSNLKVGVASPLFSPSSFALCLGSKCTIAVWVTIGSKTQQMELGEKYKNIAIFLTLFRISNKRLWIKQVWIHSHFHLRPIFSKQRLEIIWLRALSGEVNAVWVVGLILTKGQAMSEASCSVVV